VSAAEPGADPLPPPEVLPASDPVRVLLVDDQALIGECVRRMFEPEGDVRFHYVSNPMEALAAAKQFRPTVILSDLVMPQMNGLELVDQFRADESTAQIPLIVLSSMEEAATKAQAFLHGANDYLVKLPDPLELLARVRHHSAGYVSMLQRDAAYEALRQSQQMLADDLGEAARYVQSLLPGYLFGPLMATSSFVPSASLGGDAYGYHWLDDDTFALYLLDVSGHGVGAALLSVSVLNTLRMRLLRQTDFSDPGQVLGRLSETFPMQDHGGKFFTIWYGVYKPTRRELRWAGAGHPPAVLFPPDEGPRLLESAGPIPGIFEGTTYTTAAVTVPRNAHLLLFSDGLYELRLKDGRVLGLPDLLTELTFAASTGADPLKFACARAERLSGGPYYADDVSVVQVRFL
jgi:sigma-B regulation protein RsbU (phosphoserine phosphatase)